MAGAADFYYGEMEMRRWSARLSERIVLWFYWAGSGYGSRVSNPLFWWALIIGIGSYLMKFNGFTTPTYDLGRALIFATRATLPGVPTLEKLSLTGQCIEIALRLFGPVFIALFLVALRSKVMRKPSE
jgi:hypothetical protein